jgi:hypothetical protein
MDEVAGSMAWIRHYTEICRFENTDVSVTLGNFEISISQIRNEAQVALGSRYQHVVQFAYNDECVSVR